MAGESAKNKPISSRLSPKKSLSDEISADAKGINTPEVRGCGVFAGVSAFRHAVLPVNWWFCGLAFPAYELSLMRFHGEIMFGMGILGIVFALSAVLVARKIKCMRDHGRLCRGCMVVAAVLMCLPAFSSFVDASVAMAFWLLGGIGVGLSLVLWFSQIVRQELKVAVAGIALSMTLGALLHLLVFLVECFIPYVSSVTTVLAAFIWIVFLCKAQREGLRPDTSEDKASRIATLPIPRRSFVVGLFAFFAVLAFYFGIAYPFAEGILEDATISLVLSLALKITLPFAMYLWLSRCMRHREEVGLPSVMVLTAALAVLIILFLDRDSKVVLLSIQQAANWVTLLLLCLIVLAFVKRGSFESITIFCTVFALYGVSLGVGLAVSGSSLVTELFRIFPHEGIYLLTACLCVLVFYGLAIVAGFYREELYARSTTVVLETSFIDARCDELGHTYALTDRELEIAKLLCHGRSRSYIAENLYLSENTVKWYCRQIYQKLNIHKRQELLTLIGVA